MVSDDPPSFDVHGATFDLTGYLSTLLDGDVTFGIDVWEQDAYVIDYAKLTLDGTVVPLPSAALLGVVALGYSAWRLRRTQ